MLRLLKDPLIHFLLLGGVLFLLFAWRGELEEADPFQIVITDEEVQSMWQALAILHGHVPTRDEMWGMLEPSIKDEILYREALALGLDQNDSQVRARLTEKMLFLTQDVAEPTPPTDTELAAFFNVDPARFVQSATISFEQRFFSPSRHGEQLDVVAEAALTQLREGDIEVVSNDEVLFDNRYEGTAVAAIGRAFGDDFVEALAALPAENVWQGPLCSDFGLHVVRVFERTESYQLELDEVRTEVTTALMAQRRIEANEAEYRKLRDRYEIVVNLPEFHETALESDTAPEPAE